MRLMQTGILHAALINGLNAHHLQTSYLVCIVTTYEVVISE